MGLDYALKAHAEAPFLQDMPPYQRFRRFRYRQRQMRSYLFWKADFVKELQYFLDHKVAQVKFVDRTFNCNHQHAMEIWKYIYSVISVDRITDDLLNLFLFVVSILFEYFK